MDNILQNFTRQSALLTSLIGALEYVYHLDHPANQRVQNPYEPVSKNRIHILTWKITGMRWTCCRFKMTRKPQWLHWVGELLSHGLLHRALACLSDPLPVTSTAVALFAGSLCFACVPHPVSLLSCLTCWLITVSLKELKLSARTPSWDSFLFQRWKKNVPLFQKCLWTVFYQGTSFSVWLTLF